MLVMEEKKEFEHKHIETAFEKEMVKTSFIKQVEEYKEKGRPGLEPVPATQSFTLAEFNQKERFNIIFSYLFTLGEEKDKTKEPPIYPGPYAIIDRIGNLILDTDGNPLDLNQIIIPQGNKINKSIRQTGKPQLSSQFQKRLYGNGKIGIHIQREIIDKCLVKILVKHQAVISLYLFPHDSINKNVVGFNSQQENELRAKESKTRKNYLYEAVEALASRVVRWQIYKK